MPHGWLTERRPRPDFAEKFGMVECDEPGYPARTFRNARDSDATLYIYANGQDGKGLGCTLRACQKLDRPFLPLEVGREGEVMVPAWLDRHQVEVLNVAGNRQSSAPPQHNPEWPDLSWPGMFAWARDYLRGLLGSIPHAGRQPVPSSRSPWE